MTQSGSNDPSGANHQIVHLAVEDRSADAGALLSEVQEDKEVALSDLRTLVYEELRRMAHNQLRGEREGHTLRTTGLVHEAYLKLVDQDTASWTDRQHFYAVAAQAMRRVLVDWARRRQAQKRGGDRSPVPLEEGQTPEIPARNPADILAVNDALERLAEQDERMARVVECRLFGGYTLQETADALDVSRSTVTRDWRAARAWLNREFAPAD